MITSNLEFGEWGNIFNDEIMAAAIIDRLIPNSVIKSFKGLDRLHLIGQIFT